MKDSISTITGVGQAFGLPFWYKDNTDPKKRVWTKYYGSNAYMISIIPGIFRFNPKINVDFSEIKETDSEEAIQDLIKKQVKASLDEDHKTSQLDDLRMYSFAPALQDFASTLSMLIAHFYPLIVGQLSTFENKKVQDTSTFQEGFLFAVEKNTSASESASNEYGDSFLSKITESGSNIVGEVAMITGNMENMERKAIGENAEDIGNDTLAQFKSILNGEKLILPRIWKNSRYSKSYNINMKFFSPYGDRESIWNNVYMPVLVLLAMTLPRQKSFASYDANYLVQVDCPGYFSVDIGAITNLSIVRGGTENLWSYDGLPLAIDVSLQIEDLYSSMMLSEDSTYLKYNIGLRNLFLNMAGLRAENANFKENFLSWASLKLKPLTGLPAATDAMIKQKANELSSRFFR